MRDRSLVARATPSHLRQVRRQLLETGDVAEGLLNDSLRRSWQRSQRFGLMPVGHAADAPHASAAQLARACDQQREWLAHARPVMEFLFAQTRDTDSLVILADAQGLLLQALGDTRLLDRAQRVALRPGANWQERWRGTNAIGTALADRAPVVIHAGEHYLARNGFLTCTAAPITDSGGQVLGALDLSSDHRGFNPHTLALVCTAARMIEHRWFDTRHAAHWRVRLHAQPEGLGTLTEGLLALCDQGWLVGANATALQQLGLDWTALGGRTIDSLLLLDMPRWCDWAARTGPTPQAVRRADGQRLWLRIEASPGALAGRSPTRPLGSRAWPGLKPGRPAALQGDALARLDQGDSAMQALIARTRRVLDKPISLLLQGETGVGKERFVRALHASSLRREGPLVAVNCAALPEPLIESELFGYRPGAFTGAGREGAPGRILQAQGGTLFLDEIGDMPATLQARLLRVLQEREVIPLGGGKAVAVDFRLVCATHRDLRSDIDSGRFRADLYYRLNGLSLPLPPLRERQDLAALIDTVLHELLPDRALRVTPELLQGFKRYHWPGNLRQLHNALQTACALLDDDEQQIDWHLLPDDLAADLRRLAGPPAANGAGQPMGDLRAPSPCALQQTLESCAGNRSEAARRLGISRNTLYRRLRQPG